MIFQYGYSNLKAFILDVDWTLGSIFVWMPIIILASYIYNSNLKIFTWMSNIIDSRIYLRMDTYYNIWILRSLHKYNSNFKIFTWISTVVDTRVYLQMDAYYNTRILRPLHKYIDYSEYSEEKFHMDTDYYENFRMDAYYNQQSRRNLSGSLIRIRKEEMIILRMRTREW